MSKLLNMLSWRDERYWLGKLLEYPEIMAQWETFEELKQNLRDAFRLMVLDEVHHEHHNGKTAM